VEKIKVYTYHGFGDQCICYGILKEFAKRYNEVKVYSDVMNKNTFNSITRLYSSLKNVELIDEVYKEEIHAADHKIAHTKYWFDKVLPWYQDPSLPPPEWFKDDWWFDRQWYLNASLPFNLKWDNFYFERDLNKEKEVFYDILGLKDNQEFLFFHEDPVRNYNINKKHLNANIKWIDFFNYQDISILDILYTIEHAKEVHTFNTSTLTFIDLMNIQHPALYYHMYVRPSIFDSINLRLPWNLIT